MTQIVDRLIAVFDSPSGRSTYGEGITQREHALQSAWLAEKEGASPALVTAALLHDVGHLLHDLGEDVAERGIDSRHEALGAAFLMRHFGEDVVGPVALHVEAKRYLVSAEPGYAEKLSEASVRSLELQGGAMSKAEAERFASKRFAKDALRLRRWDEEAKLVDYVTPEPAHFRKFVEAALR
ncbi:MAG: metal-dependent phosphohydrolase [Rhodospirillales bacterium]|nr:metal-dependent phosphohydrolase [Rhodospirillales bacterium]